MEFFIWKLVRAKRCSWMLGVPRKCPLSMNESCHSFLSSLPALLLQFYESSLQTTGACDLDRSIWLRQSSRSADISRLPLNYVNQQWPGMVLRSRLLVVGAVGTGGTWDGEEKEVSPCSYAVGDLAEKSGSEDQKVEEDEDSASKVRTVKVAIAAAATVVLGVGNRVLYKLALVPLKHYPFSLAQLATFGYVVVYFSISYLRYHAGIVTDEMLSIQKAPFLAVGLLEALGAALGMAAGVLSGASIPILSQTFLVWQILLSIIFLGRRYRVNQLLGCFFVAVGVIITVASGSSAGHSLKEAGIFWSLLMIVSFLFQAADTVLKEVIFLDAARNLKGGGSVDLFVVNSYGSAFQAFFICLLLPFLSKLWGIPFSQLPNYLKDGAACFLNIGTLSTGCDGAPVLPLLFVAVNMGFNISMLYLLKISSAVVSSLASTFSVLISVCVYVAATIPWSCIIPS